MRKRLACENQHAKSRDGWHDQNGQTEAIAVAEVKEDRDDERADDRTHLPEGLLQAETTAVTEGPRGVREHGVTGGIADRLTCPLGEDPAGQFPADGQGEQRHGLDCSGRSR